MLPVEGPENEAAKNAPGDLFACGQRIRIGMFYRIGSRYGSGYLHNIGVITPAVRLRRQGYRLPQR